jgi:hypothetical protein
MASGSGVKDGLLVPALGLLVTFRRESCVRAEKISAPFLRLLEDQARASIRMTIAERAVCQRLCVLVARGPHATFD